MACAAFPPFIDGGGPISALIVAKLLRAAGHDLTVINVAGEDRHEIYDGVPVHRLRSLNIDWNYRLPRPAWKKALWHALENFNPRAFVVMRREIARLRPDIVLTDSIENINVATWAAAKSCGVPVAHILRSTFLLCWKGSMWRGGDNCARACASCRATSYGKKLSSRFVDAVIGETRFIVGRHLEHGYFPNATTHVVPGAIAPVPGAAPRPAPSPERPLRVGFIGVHDPVKGLDTLAAAAHRLVGEPVEFLIAGTGQSDYAKALPERFPSRNTRFLGWAKPDEFLPGIDILAVPSLFREPFGRVVIEAFAHGVPVIGARSGGIPETIQPGVSGALFEPGDDAALAGEIAALARDRALVARLSAGALEAAARYAPERIAAAYAAVFNSLLREPAEGALLQAGEARP
ncbi:glycosyltransferase family 4 protein [Bosea sp. CS1GBMeth4]|uniref:glycosyltransferase family 4 protein n=1 Tax=Bosea sp. CS1GBMeth4 TaxID=1892849 RepID=UPI001FCE55D0|nr:glycosyltransferase family 4 protein [Bosea sp. CS1GBMeth4]